MTPDPSETGGNPNEAPAPIPSNEPTGPAPGQPTNPGEPLRPEDPNVEPADVPGDFADDEPGEDDDDCDDDWDDEESED
jgi:hypothetical protein